MTDYKFVKAIKNGVDYYSPFCYSGTGRVLTKAIVNNVTYDFPLIHVTSITLSPSSITLTTAGQTEQLTATIAPSNATIKRINWTSSDTSVATVDDTGLVTCVTPGSATITAETVDGGYTATCSIMNGIIVDYAVIGGGGGGYGWSGSGGGGGAVIACYNILLQQGCSYYAIVGGAGGADGGNGGYSQFNGTRANGGYGGTQNYGGASGNGNGGGGSAVSGSVYARGGGGGAGGAGTSGYVSTYTYGGRGGFGASVFGWTYGGGGGGTGWYQGGYGYGGGGNGGRDTGGGTSATACGGGGGGSGTRSSGCPGGGGLVIVRYPTACGYNITGGNKSTSGDYTIHCFTSNGTLTVN